MLDMVITGGDVVDGTGGPRRRADIAINDGRVVEIGEPTSWSCPHGVERWRADCGCGSTTNEGWNQAWRAALREALDRLRDTLARPYEERAGRLLRDPWAAREAYVDILLDDDYHFRRFSLSR